MVNPKPIIATAVRAQANSVRRLERSLRIQESCVDTTQESNPGAAFPVLAPPACVSHPHLLYHEGAHLNEQGGVNRLTAAAATR